MERNPKFDNTEKALNDLREGGTDEREIPQVASVIGHGSEEYAAEYAAIAKKYLEISRCYSHCNKATSTDILIVEDNASVGKMISDILEKAGVSCHITGSANETLSYCENNTPSLVLMDIELPDADGLVLTKALKANPNMKNTPVIVVTGHVDNSTMNRAMEVGCENFIGKPFTKDYLLRTVQRQLDELHSV